MSSSKYRRVATTVATGLSATLASLALAASASADQPSSPGGMFVIGDQSAQVGAQVTFWGAQWWKGNVLSWGAAPAAFKGYSDQPATCGQAWSTRPGNSSFPPATVGATIPVIVASNITQDGSVISGDTTEVVLVATDPGYGPDPGHPGTGTVVAVQCGGGPSPS